MNGLSSDFDRLHTALAEALVACRADTSKHAVHSLRTGTRKLEALLQKVLEDHPGAGQLHKTARKTRRELKRIRRAAGPVRDLDVHQQLAEELRDHGLPSKNVGSGKTLAKDYKQLDHSLQRRRDRAANKLQKLLKREEVRLESALEDTAEALAQLAATSPSPLQTATKWTRASSVPDVDPGADSFQEKLHGYRKQTKAARYVAGLQESSAAARRLAKRLKEVQDSIGRWHDLMLLTSEAAEVLGKHSALTAVARSQRDSALEVATRSLQTMNRGPGPAHVRS